MGKLSYSSHLKKGTFQYPEAFRKFLIAENGKIQQILLAEITAADAVIEVAKIKAEEEREAAEQFKLEELPAKAGRKTTSKSVAGGNYSSKMYAGLFLFFCTC